MIPASGGAGGREGGSYRGRQGLMPTGGAGRGGAGQCVIRAMGTVVL